LTLTTDTDTGDPGAARRPVIVKSVVHSLGHCPQPRPHSRRDQHASGTVRRVDTAQLDDLVPLIDPTALPRVLGRSEALARGYNRNMIDHRLRAGHWQRVLPRTYLTADTLGWTDRLRAALTFAGPEALLTGAAALCDDGLRAVSRPASVLVLVPISTRLRSTKWVRIRPTRRLPERALLPGPARVPPARAVADLALERRQLDDVRALVSEVVRRRLCTVAELTAELEQGPRNGSACLRAALEDVGAGAWSAPEARAASVLRRAGVPRFEQNVRIRLPGGHEFVVDFLWRALRAVLEIDSVEHHFSPPDRDATMRRHLVLETLGFSVVHRSPAVVWREPARFAREIATWLAARAAAVRG
jgi:very-short-patch-repair endonuclease